MAHPWFKDTSDCRADAQVAILLATKNGARFLDDQLKSYLSQHHLNWVLHVSDDASEDGTVGMIRRFADEHNARVFVRQGPDQGFCRNFMSLARDRAIAGDYFAFSDQDDIWRDDKLARAIGFLSRISPAKPALYCSRTEVVDERGGHLGFSPRFRRKPTFQNALVQNIGGGNTMVFNAAAKRLLESNADVAMVSHDWWVYQVVAGVGGVVFYDPVPTVAYRQHGASVLGANLGLRARLQRFRMVWNGRLRTWNDVNLAGLRTLMPLLHAGSRWTLDNFSAARDDRRLFVRLYHLCKSGVYRQTPLDQVALYFAVIAGKL
jgi:glycosyltransferase involved in cell wall biosynthesis